jgi:hypothetical protein
MQEGGQRHDCDAPKAHDRFVTLWEGVGMTRGGYDG